MSSTTVATFSPAADVFVAWRHRVLSGEKPVFYPCGDKSLKRIEIGPGLVTLVGGAPGIGKTAFVMQLVIDGLRLNSELRTLIANVEVSPEVLFDRQLARLSGIDAQRIRRREFHIRDGDRMDAGLHVLESIANRLAFLKPPFDIRNLAAASDTFGAQLIVLDYIQRFCPLSDNGDRRGGIDAIMGHLRQFSDAGTAVIVVAALARQKDQRGRSSYSKDALTLASYRETSELEYGADDAFLLVEESPGSEIIALRHVKARHSQPLDIALRFDRPRQQFVPLADHGDTAPHEGDVR